MGAVYKIEVEDFKRLKACRVVATTGTVLGLSGKNDQGKSSFSDAIAAVLGGKSAISDTDQPVRKGAKRAAITFETEEWRAEQIFTAKSSTLKVVDKEGEQWTEPRTRFARMLAPFSFDIGGFCRLKPKEMRDALLRACGLGDKLAEIDRKRAAVYASRTDANRERERLQNALSLMTKPVGAPLEYVTIDAARAEFNAANEAANVRRRMAEDVQRAEMLVERNADLVERLKRELAGARVQLAESEEARDTKRVQLENEPEIDLEAAAAKIGDIEQINRAVTESLRYNEMAADVAAAQSVWEEFDAGVKAFDGEKAALIAGVKLPIDGLEILDADVLLDGIPLGQGSQSAKIKVGLAVSMASDPPIRIARITDASLLDEDSVNTVVEWAAESDYLVLMEFVANEPVGMEHELWIEDGEAVPVEVVLGHARVSALEELTDE